MNARRQTCGPLFLKKQPRRTPDPPTKFAPAAFPESCRGAGLRSQFVPATQCLINDSPLSFAGSMLVPITARPLAFIGDENVGRAPAQLKQGEQ
jgi:hypothetical protein